MLPFQTNFEEAKSVNNQPEQTVNNQGFTGDAAPYGGGLRENGIFFILLETFSTVCCHIGEGGENGDTI